jgi:hypothetical protein
VQQHASAAPALPYLAGPVPAAVPASMYSGGLQGRQDDGLCLQALLFTCKH